MLMNMAGAFSGPKKSLIEALTGKKPGAKVDVHGPHFRHLSGSLYLNDVSNRVFDDNTKEWGNRWDGTKWVSP